MLSTIACDRHLRTETVGRVAVMVDDHPEIFPVNYAVDERGDIYFRTDSGTKLHAAATARDHRIRDRRFRRGSGAGLERPRSRSGPVARSRAGHRQGPLTPLKPWAAGEKANVVRLSPTKMTGRQLSRPRSATA